MLTSKQVRRIDKLIAKRDRVTCEQSIRSLTPFYPSTRPLHIHRGISHSTPLPLGEGQGGGAACCCCCRCRCCSSSFFSVLYQHFIGCATSSLTTFLQYILFDKVVEVTSCGILRTVIYLVPLRGSQFPFKTIEEHVEYLSLSVV